MLTKKQIIKNLKKIKIKEKYVIIHSDITGLIFQDFSLDSLWKIIFECFGKKKTYIFPTFTFNLKNKICDYSATKSEAGVLSEFFRKKIIMHGNFKLKSGEMSDLYINCRKLYEYPELTILY